MNTQPPSHAIEVREVWRVFTMGTHEVPALRGLTLDVASGCFVALKGRSGSGKTTLLNCLSGLDRPTSGAIHVLGRDIVALNDVALTQWRRECLGFVFQKFGLLPHLSAYENVELMLRITGAPARDRHARTLACLDLVGLRKWQDHRPHEMSGGQQQRVAIARALVHRPRLILADEPTGDLDSTTAREILALFRQIVHEEQMTLLMASHDSLVDEYADRVVHLRDGQVADQAAG